MTSGQKRELWEQPFQACAIDADCAVKPDGQNSVISFVISELSIPAAGQKDRRLWGRECNLRVFVLWRMPEMVAPRALRFLPQARRIVGSGDENGSSGKVQHRKSAIQVLINVSSLNILEVIQFRI